MAVNVPPTPSTLQTGQAPRNAAEYEEARRQIRQGTEDAVRELQRRAAAQRTPAQLAEHQARVTRDRQREAERYAAQLELRAAAAAQRAAAQHAGPSGVSIRHIDYSAVHAIYRACRALGFRMRDGGRRAAFQAAIDQESANAPGRPIDAAGLARIRAVIVNAGAAPAAPQQVASAMA